MQNNTPQSHAFQAASLTQWPLFALSQRSKTPAISGWPSAAYAQADLPGAGARWAKDANWGIPLIDGLAFLDLDVPKAEGTDLDAVALDQYVSDWTEYFAGYLKSKSAQAQAPGKLMIVRTGSGGAHIWFRVAPGDASRKLPVLDLPGGLVL